MKTEVVWKGNLNRQVLILLLMGRNQDCQTLLEEALLIIRNAAYTFQSQ